MDDVFGVNGLEAIDELLEHVLCAVFLQTASFADVVQKVSSWAHLKDKQNVLLSLEGLVKPDDIGVADLLENVDLLHDLPLGGVFLEVILVDGLDGDQFFCQTMHS